MNERKIYRSDLLGEEYTLIHHRSGLNIYVFPKQLATTYAVFSTEYGSADNRFRLACDKEWIDVPDGVAHFLEHKMFANEDGIDSFEKFGALGANANAYTSHDQTAYLFGCSEKFEESLEELLTYVTHPYFTPESVTKEQGIIAQEIRMGDDNPSSRRYYQLLRALYGNRQIYTQICGTVESIAQITAQTLYDCYRVFYNLSNMVLVVCGDVDVETVLSVADRILPVQEEVEILRDRPEEPKDVICSKLSCQMEIAQPIFAIGIKDAPFFYAPADRVRRGNALDILCEMLFNQSGELFNSLYQEGLITGSLGFGYDEGRTYAFVGLSGESPDPDAVLERVKETVENAKKNGLSRIDFTRCKRVMYAELVREFDSTTDIADLILDAVQSGIEPFDFVSILDSVTFEDVEAVLHEVFRPEAYALSVIYPKEEQK